MTEPIEAARVIGDKLIRGTPFAYRLEPFRPRRIFDRMHFVDFSRTLGRGRPAVAYAWTRLTVPQAMRLRMEFEHSDGLAIWLNGRPVYAAGGERAVQLRRDERSFELSHACVLDLLPGANTLLLRAETAGREWCVYLQPPSDKGAVVNGAVYPEIGLRGLANVDDRVAELSNWLLIGPFNPADPGGGDILSAAAEIQFGRMYPGLDGPVTWTIPKVEVLGGLIDPLPWGTNYNWNYHNGGTAWAMQLLAEATRERKYGEFAGQFCDFHLAGIPFVEHQVKTLNAVESANHWIIETPLLDFTLAPSLPFLHRLRTEREFAGRPEYERWVARMMHYARREQIRLPGLGIYTRTTPVKFTTWADDMFMGIPFLVQAARYAASPAERQALFDDAAAQMAAFPSQVWDAEAKLYVHARYWNHPARLPHWSRCNGWAIWAASEVLLHLPSGHPLRPVILEQFRRHAASLLRWQTPEGFWRNLIDRPAAAPEVSGTAIFVMAFARGVRHGWLPAAEYAPAVGCGWAALASRIEPDGTVHDICAGTMCTEDEEYYMNRPFYDDDTHGLFAVLFAALEVQSLFAHRPALRDAASALAKT